MLSEDIRHGGKVNRNIRCSVVRSSILWRYSVVVGSVLNETADSHASMSNTLARTRKRSRRKSKPAKLPLDHSSVINLSNSILSPDEIFVLARGLTFCPTPRHINWPEISADIYDFARRMRLTEYFFDENNTTNVNKRDNP